MRSMTYTCGVDPLTSIDLIDPAGINVKRIESLRTGVWETELAARGVTSATRKARSVTITATCADLAMLDRACLRFDADMSASTPLGGRGIAGTLEVDDWTQRALVTGIEPAYEPPGPATFTLTIALLDGVWRHRGITRYYSLTGDSDGLDYPYGYPHDYGASERVNVADNLMETAMPFEMRIYGPATDPQVSVAGNLYALDDLELAVGEYVLIDSVAKTITLVHSNGDTESIFAKGRRGTGVDGGEYIFQPIPAGRSNLTWQGFALDLTIIDERSTPAWQISS